MEKKNNFLIGLFVIISLLIFVGIIVITVKSKFIKDGYYLKTNYNHISGLKEGDEVSLGGYRIGQVEKVVMLTKNGVHFEVWLFINKSVPILKGTVAEIKSKGLVGEKYIEMLCPIREKVFVHPYDVIKGVQSREYLDEVVNNLDMTAQDISDFFRTNKLNNTLDTVNNILTADVKGTIQLVQQDLIKIGQTMDSLQKTTKDFSRTADNITDIAVDNKKQLKETISQLNSDLVTLNNVLSNLEKITSENRENIKSIVANLKSTTVEVNELSKDIKQQPWKLLRK